MLFTHSFIWLLISGSFLISETFIWLSLNICFNNCTLNAWDIAQLIPSYVLIVTDPFLNCFLFGFCYFTSNTGHAFSRHEMLMSIFWVWMMWFYWFIRSNLSLSPEESWLPIASILFCIVHIQVQASLWSITLFFFPLLVRSISSAVPIYKCWCFL